MPDAVLFQIDSLVCTILFNRPERRNAVNDPTAAALLDAFERFEADDAPRAAVLGGTGGHLCTGVDLTAVGDPSRCNHLDPDDDMLGPTGPSRMALSKLFIVAVSGYVMAGGLGLALLTDPRVMERDAMLGVFCRRWGASLIDGDTTYLSRIIDMGRALDMILTGRAISADEALVMGLANRVVDLGGVLAAARKSAQDIAASLRQCILTNRTSTYAQWDLPLAAALQQEDARSAPIVFTGRVEGAARFMGSTRRLGE